MAASVAQAFGVSVGLWGVLPAVTLLVGCTTDQERDVALYREETGRSAVVASDPAESTSLSLPDALALTLERNERLEIAGERLIQALAAIERQSASLLPTLDFAGVFTAHDNDGSSRTTTFDAGPVAQYDLLTGMSDFSDVEAATRDAEVERWLVRDLREAILLETGRAYYTALTTDRLIEVLHSSVALQEERLRDARARNEVGLARPLDVAQIEAQLSRTRATLLEAQQAAHDARTALSHLTGTAVGDRLLTDGWTVPGPVSAENLLAIAHEHRADLRAAEEGVRAARLRVDAEIGRYAPTVSVNLEYFLTRQSVPDERDWIAVLSINVPIFSAGRIEADVRAAWSVFRESLLSLSLTRRAIAADVDVASARVRSTAARVAEFRRLVELAGETLRQAEGSYSAGLGTNLERLVAQDALLAAQLELAQVEAEEKISSLALLRAVGTLGEGALGLPPPPPREDQPLPTSPFIDVAEIGHDRGPSSDSDRAPTQPPRSLP